MKSILEFRNVSFSYPDGTVAIRGLSLEICEGQRIAILGSNGSGKTTLFLLLNGIHKIASGDFFFRDKSFSYNSNSLLDLRKSVGIVFQDPDTQIFSASVIEEIAFGLLNLGLKENAIRNKIDTIVKELHIAHLLEKPTHLLSYGEKKRVSLASILVMEPEVLILDEPTSGLDPKESTNLIHLLDDISASGKTILLSTHNVDFAYSWADQIIVMKEGNILKAGKPLEIFRDESLLKESHLEMPFIEELIQSLGLGSALNAKSAVSKEKLFAFLNRNGASSAMQVVNKKGAKAKERKIKK